MIDLSVSVLGFSSNSSGRGYFTVSYSTWYVRIMYRRALLMLLLFARGIVDCALAALPPPPAERDLSNSNSCGERISIETDSEDPVRADINIFKKTAYFLKFPAR